MGRYQLVKLLGEGGMGSVHKAHDPTLNRFVALKFIHGSNQEYTRRLLLEGRAQAKIEHPNVCRVYEVGQIDDHDIHPTDHQSFAAAWQKLAAE